MRSAPSLPSSERSGLPSALRALRSALSLATVLRYNRNGASHGIMHYMQANGPHGTPAERLSELARRYNLADIHAFGSRGREVAALIKRGRAIKRASTSDVDVGVRPKRGARLSARDLANLTAEMEDLFAVSKIDLVLVPASEPFLALDIVRGELLYTEDPLDQAYFELFVLRRAGDLLPFKRERIDMILRGEAR